MATNHWDLHEEEFNGFLFHQISHQFDVDINRGRASETKCVAEAILFDSCRQNFTFNSISVVFFFSPAKGNCIKRIWIKKKKRAGFSVRPAPSRFFGRLLVAFWNLFTHVIKGEALYVFTQSTLREPMDWAFFLI